MAFTVGTGTFTNGSTTVTNVSLSSGTLAYFASGTRMIIGANPVTAEVEAVAAPTVTTITLRSPWLHTGGTYDFLANQTSEGLRDAVQSIRNNNTTLQNYIDSISKAPNADTVVERTSTGAARVADAQNADESVALGQLPDDVADLYAKNNILGSVSQSGGVPTGAIIERGSNVNGEYVKFADGTLICTHIKRVEYGSAPDALGIDDWAFPATPASNAPTALSFMPVRYNADGNEDVALANVGVADALRASCRNASTALGSQSIAVRLYLERSVQDSFVSGDYFNVSCFMKSRWS